MKDSSNICLSCGLCCDGTLIGFVQLENDELPRMKEVMDIIDDNGNGFFLNPCNKYCAGCTIYSERPKQCASFECKLLKNFEQKELNFDSAVEIVNAIKEKKSAIEKKVANLQLELKSPSFYFKMVELKKWLRKNKESSLTQDHLALILDLEQLDSLVARNMGVSY
ncbi:Putative zinc-or iron-chelating domain-containing protein [Salegentibacter echinorum]|uniref:Putative zinc-or iron-chelating domain-containing protein n=1 Tax=Salegentibacter echinorum TaxID=1073325 RepID=A0A1M5M138_SALEC|nr:YkgJ family cysteine cluster protein [Salegentibacter echinorum]SHG70609.1 Putative zinc-or iron-chelating domain-containing protein [Salegentibacter echinorum]